MPEQKHVAALTAHLKETFKRQSHGEIIRGQDPGPIARTISVEDVAEAALEWMRGVVSTALFDRAADPLVDLVGYVVVEYNQASGQPERLADDTVHSDEDIAHDVADECRRKADAVGRGELYVVAEVHKTEVPA